MKPKLENIEVLAIESSRLFPEEEMQNEDIRVDIGFSFDVSVQDVENQIFAFAVTSEVSSPFVELKLRIGLQYSRIEKAWEDAEEPERESFLLETLLPDAYPYVRSLAQVSSGLLGVPPIGLGAFNSEELKKMGN